MLAFVYCLLAFVVFVAGMATWMCSRLQPRKTLEPLSFVRIAAAS
jgi:hypothetical protein